MPAGSNLFECDIAYVREGDGSITYAKGTEALRHNSTYHLTCRATPNIDLIWVFNIKVNIAPRLKLYIETGSFSLGLDIFIVIKPFPVTCI